MKTYVKTLILSGAMFFSVSIPSNSVFATNAPFAQLSSSKVQIPTKEPSVVSLGTVDGSSGLEVVSNNKIVIKEEGTYFVMAAGQVGADKNAASAEGYVDLWLIQNGAGVPNSNTRQFVSHRQATSVLVAQTILPLKAGDTISVGYSANKPSVGLIPTEASQKEPGIPSIIFSIFKI
jgi:hypothetical protein